MMIDMKTIFSKNGYIQKIFQLNRRQNEDTGNAYFTFIKKLKQELNKIKGYN